jgi:hypothetical protein
MTRDIIPFPNPDDQNPLRFNVINTPQPIHVKIDGNHVTLLKQDMVLCKFDRTDAETLFSSARLLTGMVKASVNLGEMEEIKDLMCDFLREANGS